MILRVRPLHFEFRARDPISFPPGTAANIFRGAFGDVFRRLTCDPACPGAKSCPHAAVCAYARMFEPRATREVGGPSGFENQPRPFVLRAASLDGKDFLAAEKFALDVNVFEPEIPALRYFQQAFAQLAMDGLGPGRPRVELVDADELPTVELAMTTPRDRVERLSLTFLTPTELKIGGEILREPRFDAVVGRARDRVTSLIALYQPAAAPVSLDFRGMGERSRAVRMVTGRFEQCDYGRRSSRTGQRHGLGGFTGEASYVGDLGEFLPYLEALWWTGLGRLTVWGNGLVRVRAAREEPKQG